MGIEKRGFGQRLKETPRQSRFGRYLCGELCWELEQNPELETPLRAARREDFRVLRFARLSRWSLSIRVAAIGRG